MNGYELRVAIEWLHWPQFVVRNLILFIV